MAIVVDNDSLVKALMSLGKVIQSSTSSPAHRCVCVIAKNGKLRLRGSDLIAYTEKIIPYQGKDEGAWLVVFESLSHYAKTSEGMMTLDFKKSELKVKSGNDQASLPLRDVSEYLTWPKWSEFKPIDCDATALVAAVSLSADAVSTSLVSILMYCVNISSTDGGIDIQASDSYRYQYYTIDGKAKRDDIKLLIPHTGASRFGDIDLPATSVAVSASMLGIKSKDSTYYFALNNDAEKYPLFRDKKVPDPTLTLEVPLAAVKSMFSKAEGFSDPSQGRKLLITATPNSLQVKVSSTNLGSYQGTITPKSGKGKPIELYLDSKHVTYFISKAKGETIKLHFSDSEEHHKPVRLEDTASPGFFYLTWPLIVQSESVTEAEE